MAPAPTRLLDTTRPLFPTGTLVPEKHPGEIGSARQSRGALGCFWGPGEEAQEAAAQIASQDALLYPGASISHMSEKCTWQWL